MAYMIDRAKLAAKAGDTELVKALIERAIPVETRDELGNTLLLLAAKNNQLKTVQCLLSLGADINANNFVGETALNFAVENLNSEMVKFLIEKGIMIDTLSVSECCTPAAVASKKRGGHNIANILWAAEKLLSVTENDSSFYSEKEKENELAIVENCLWTLKDLVHGRLARNGNTALHNAVRSRNREIALRLLRAGADPTLKNTKKPERTPMDMASEHPYRDDYLFSMMIFAVINKHLKTVVDINQEIEFYKGKEKEKAKELKELIEKRNNLEKECNGLLEKLINVSKHLTGTHKTTICFRIGEFMANAKSIFFNPKEAYRFLSKLDKKQNPEEYKKAHEIIFGLAAAGYIDSIVDTEEGTILEPSKTSSNDRLKCMIQSLFAAQNFEVIPLSKLFASYFFGETISQHDFSGVKGVDPQSFLNLIEHLRKLNLNLNEELTQLKTKMKFEREKEKEKEKEALLETKEEKETKEGKEKKEKKELKEAEMPEAVSQIIHQYQYTSVRDKLLNPLFYAVRRNQVPVVKRYLTENLGFKYTDKNDYGNTPFLVSAIQGSLDVMMYLMDAFPIDINECNPNGDNAWTLAAANGNINVLKVLHLHQAITTHKNNQGETALLCAARTGQTATIQFLLDNNLDTLEETNNRGENAIYTAVKADCIDILRYLLSLPQMNSEVINKQSAFGRTALSHAAHLNKKDMLSLLLKNGATMDLDDHPSMKVVIRSGNLVFQEHSDHFNETYSLLLKAHKLLRFTRNGYEDRNMDEIESLLNDLGDAISGSLSIDGNTALHCAILKEDRTLVRRLLEAGVHLSIENNRGITAFSLAMLCEDTYIQALIFCAKILELLENCQNIQNSSMDKKLKQEQIERINKNIELLMKNLMPIWTKYQSDIQSIEYTGGRDLPVNKNFIMNFEYFSCNFGLLHSMPNTVTFNPNMAFYIFSHVKKSSHQKLYQVALKTIYEMIRDNHLVLKASVFTLMEESASKALPLPEKDSLKDKLISGLHEVSGLEEGLQEDSSLSIDDPNRVIYLRNLIELVLFADICDETLNLGKLVSEYIMGHAFHMTDIKDLKKMDADSMQALVFAAKELQLKALSEKETLNKLEREKDKEDDKDKDKRKSLSKP